MKSVTFYNVKVKIVSLYFKIRAISHTIEFRMCLGGKVLDAQQVAVKQGLLQKNVTLQSELREKEKRKFQRMKIEIIERKGSKVEVVGLINLDFDEFRDMKMKKINLLNCFDNSAYMQVFLLLLPSRMAQQSESEQSEEVKQISPQKTTNNNLYVNQNEEESQLTFSNLREESEARSTPESKDQEVQTLDIQSLLTLNAILTQNNQRLEIENQNLKGKVQILQKSIEEKEVSKQLQLNLKAQIQSLQNRIIQKQSEIKSKDQLIQTMKKEKESMSKENNGFLPNLSKQEVKIDSIVSELGKYSETVKKYKLNLNITKPKMASQTSLSDSIVSESTFKDINIQTQRNRKEELKKLLRGTDRETSKADETLDSMRESLRYAQ